MNRLDFILGIPSILLLQKDKEYDFPDVPPDGRVYKLKTNSKEFDALIMVQPMVLSVGEYTKQQDKNEIGKSQVGVIGRRISSKYGTTRDVMIYMHVEPFTAETKVGTVTFRIFECKQLIEKFNEIIRIGGNLKLLKDFEEIPEVFFNELTIGVHLEKKMDINSVNDKELKDLIKRNEIAMLPYKEDTLKFHVRNKTKKILIGQISTIGMDQLRNGLIRVNKWLESVP